jgi:hypothetical protein
MLKISPKANKTIQTETGATANVQEVLRFNNDDNKGETILVYIGDNEVTIPFQKQLAEYLYEYPSPSDLPCFGFINFLLGYRGREFKTGLPSSIFDFHYTQYDDLKPGDVFALYNNPNGDIFQNGDKFTSSVSAVCIDIDRYLFKFYFSPNLFVANGENLRKLYPKTDKNNVFQYLRKQITKRKNSTL